MRVLDANSTERVEYVSIIFVLPTEYEIPIPYWYRGISANRRAYKVNIFLSKPISWVTENEIKQLIKDKFNLDISIDRIVVSGF